MTKYREILRLKDLGLSARAISMARHVSRNTVSKVLACAEKNNLSWDQARQMTDKQLAEIFTDKNSQTRTEKKMPDFEYIRKELLHDGVNKKLLWAEYCEECNQSGDSPLMYSQFCYYIQQDEQKRRATMHIHIMQ